MVNVILAQRSAHERHVEQSIVPPRAHRRRTDAQEIDVIREMMVKSQQMMKDQTFFLIVASLLPPPLRISTALLAVILNSFCFL